MHQFDFLIYTENENKEARNLFRAISVFFFRISLIVQFLFIVQLSKYTEGEHDFEPLLPWLSVPFQPLAIFRLKILILALFTSPVE